MTAAVLRIRGDIPRVTRLSRKTLAIAGAAAGALVSGALFWALRTPPPADPPEVLVVSNANPAKSVMGAPAGYDDLPVFDPPRPGEAGQANMQRSDSIGPAATAFDPASGADPHAAAREQARERAQREREAAAASRLFLGADTAQPLGSGASGAMSAAPDPTGAPDKAPSRSDARRQFLARDDRSSFESDERIVAASSPFILQAGAVIPAALITGIRSDLPGQISAQVTQNIYDSPTGRILLIPQGARLIGEYDSEIVAGQTRILLAWDRLILPGGRSVRLDRQPGADAAGMAGLEDRVNNHWGRMVRAALVSSLLGAGSELAAGGESELVRALRAGVQEGTNEAGRRVVERELSVPPTLTVRPGFAFRIIVTRDLRLEPIEGSTRP
ncbi:MAG: TrbI/VirB10 family protein [Sphingopyxis sp.]